MKQIPIKAWNLTNCFRPLKESKQWKYVVHHRSVNSISDNWNDSLQSLNQEKNEASVPVFTRIGRQFQSLKRQAYAVSTSVSFPLCQRSSLIWRIMTNSMTHVVIFLLASFFGRSYHSRYQNFEFIATDTPNYPQNKLELTILLTRRSRCIVV